MLDNFTQPRTGASTNEYVSLNKVENCNSSKFVVQFKENNVNAIKYKVLVSIDGTNYEALVSDVVIAKNGSTYETIEGAWRCIDVQIASNVAGSHGNATVTISGLGGY